MRVVPHRRRLLRVGRRRRLRVRAPHRPRRIDGDVRGAQGAHRHGLVRGVQPRRYPPRHRRPRGQGVHLERQHRRAAPDAGGTGRRAGVGAVAPQGQRPPRGVRGLHRVDVERGQRGAHAGVRGTQQQRAVRRVLPRRPRRRHRFIRRLAPGVGASERRVRHLVPGAPLPRRAGDVRRLPRHDPGVDADGKRGQHVQARERRERQGARHVGRAHGDGGVRRAERRFSIRRVRRDRR